MTWERDSYSRDSVGMHGASSAMHGASGTMAAGTSEPAGNFALLESGRRASDPVQSAGKAPARPEFVALIAMARQIRRDIEILEREIARLGCSEGGNWDDYASLFEEVEPHDGSTWRDGEDSDDL